MHSPLHLLPQPAQKPPSPGPRKPGLLQRCGRSLRGITTRLVSEDRGAVTAEYAIVILAAVAFAGLLVAIMQSSEIRAMLVQLVEDALGAGE